MRKGYYELLEQMKNETDSFKHFLLQAELDAQYPMNSTRIQRAGHFMATEFSEKATQCEMLLDYLHKYGNITQLEAIRAFGCSRLAARVSDLRDDGYPIITEINPLKGAKKYAIYRLNEEEDDGK